MTEELKPKPISEKITKEEYEKVKEEYKKDDKKPKQPTINKLFKWNQKTKMNKSTKKPDMILCFLLNMKKQIEGPILTKIYGGNFLVIRNHVYRFNPQRVFQFGKYKAVIAKEYDRELVGIDDYEKLVMEDFLSKNPGARVNIDDPVLIKAVIMAHLSEKPKMSGNMWLIIILAIIGVIGGFFAFSMLGKKGGSTPAVNATAP